MRRRTHLFEAMQPRVAGVGTGAQSCAGDPSEQRGDAVG